MKNFINYIEHLELVDIEEALKFRVDVSQSLIRSKKNKRLSLDSSQNTIVYKGSFQKNDIEYDTILSEEPKKDSPESYINGNTIQSFVENVSQQAQEDILNAFLLAQRAATKIYPNKNDTRLWYDTYFEVLTNIGWTLENNFFQQFACSERLFEMKKVLLSIMGNIITENGIGIIKKLLETISDLKDERIQIFNKRTIKENVGCFQLGIASEQNAVVSVSMGVFFVNAETNINQILLFNTNRQLVTMEYCTFKATLNYNVFTDETRKMIKSKLGNCSDYISKLEI